MTISSRQRLSAGPCITPGHRGRNEVKTELAWGEVWDGENKQMENEVKAKKKKMLHIRAVLFGPRLLSGAPAQTMK